MPDIFEGQVVGIISGPKHCIRRTVSTEETFVEGVSQGKKAEAIKEFHYWVVVAQVQDEWGGSKERTFIFCSPDEAAKVTLGYSYHY